LDAAVQGKCPRAGAATGRELALQCTRIIYIGRLARYLTQKLSAETDSWHILLFAPLPGPEIPYETAESRDAAELN
jgi:hypothetical protein